MAKYMVCKLVHTREEKNGKVNNVNFHETYKTGIRRKKREKKYSMVHSLYKQAGRGHGNVIRVSQWLNPVLLY